MDENKNLRAEAVAAELGISTRTLDLWYRWKARNPDNPLTELLPDYTTVDGKRMWSKDDLVHLAAFKDSIPRGRNGLMGELTNTKRRK